MSELVELSPAFPATRAALQRVAVHVLARARHQATGRFGLRATPGGFGTPAFGWDVEVLRVAGPLLVRERGKVTSTARIDGSTLAALAEFAGVDLGADFSAGHETPPLGDVDAPLEVDAGGAAALAAWYEFAWRVLDDVGAGLGDDASPSVIQLWPEHFDAGVDVGVSERIRVNLGASPGDGWHPDPYLYVGPWDDRRPGDDGYWNAPFGAALRYAEVRAGADPAGFLRHGVARLQSARMG